MAALRGQPVDRIPISFWGHNFARENSPTELSDETLRLAATFDWDFLKPQVRAQAFAEMWGLTYKPSHERAVSYTTTNVPLQGAADFRALQAVDPRSGALGEQLAALDAIRAGAGPDTPIIWTIFAPLMVARYLVHDQDGAFLRMVHTEPAAIERGLAPIAETLAEYARACLEHGADGLFYATNMATRAALSAEECRRLQRAFDVPILDVVQAAPFNMLHICGSQVLFDEFADYPVDCFNWSLDGTNPTLADGHRKTSKAVVGGIPAKPGLKSMTPAEVAERAEAAVQDTQGRWYLMAADCSINPDTPDELLFAAREVAYRSRTA